MVSDLTKVGTGRFVKNKIKIGSKKMEKMAVISVTIYQSPCGVLRLGECEGRVCLCDWLERKHRMAVDNRLRKRLNGDFKEQSTPLLERVVRELDEYFAGIRREFDIPLQLAGTAFQQDVWNAILSIPYGKTRTYKEIAEYIGSPQSVRAVANATGANALSILIPCHRIVGSDGTLTGYAGGLPAKRHLLTLETAGQ